MEEWRDIEGFEGYQISNRGRVRTFWIRKHYPTGYGTFSYLGDTPKIMPMSDDGNGYMKVMLYSTVDGKRYCKKVHRLVAEAFIDKPYGDDFTVDHIQSGRKGKLNNCVDNLRWISRSENIKKAYRDGMCDNRILRQNKAIMVYDEWTGDWQYFDSIGDAAYKLRLNRTSISHCLRGDMERLYHYRFDYADGEDRLLYGIDECDCR